MKTELQTVIKEIKELLDVAENTLCYCEMDMDRKGLRDISEGLKDMYNRNLVEQRCYQKVLNLLSTLSDEDDEEYELVIDDSQKVKIL